MSEILHQLALPSSWTSAPLWSHFRRLKRTGYENEELLSVYRDYGVIPRTSRDDNFNKAPDDLSGYQLVEVGDLVVNKMKAWQGSLGVSSHRGIVSPAYFVYASRSELGTRFSHYLLRSQPYASWYRAISKGIRPNQWDLIPEDFGRVPVLTPPLHEQRAIADFLDRETAQIDATIDAQERLVELLEERRDSGISHAVTHGLDQDVTLADSGYELLGDIPVHWHAAPLGRLLAKKVTDGPHATPEFLDEGIPFLSVDGIQGGELVFEGCRYVSPEDHDEFSKKTLPKWDDILMGKAASTGKIARVKVDSEFSIWSPLALIRVDRYKVEPAFVEMVLKSMSSQRQIDLLCTYNTQKNIAMADIPRIAIAIPPRSEQQKIASRLDRHLTRTRSMIAKAQESIILMKERRAALISAAVTGRINVRTGTEQVGRDLEEALA